MGKKTRHLLFFLFLTINLSVLFAQTRIVPHVTAAGGGFQTTVVFSNNSNQDETIQVIPFLASGQALDKVQRDVSSGQTLTISTAELFGAGVAVSHFEIVNTSTEVIAQVIYEFGETPESKAHVSELNELSSEWMVFPGDWSLIFDGIAMVNKGNSSTQVMVNQYDFTGNLLHEMVIQDLAPSAKTAFTLGAPSGSEFIETGDSFFKIQADQELALIALRGTPPNIRPGYLWSNPAHPVFTSSVENEGLTPLQRSADFDQLVHFINKYYGPLFWKNELLGVDVLAQADSFQQRILKTDNDLDFFDEMAGFISTLSDGHTGFSVPSTYVAILPFGVDLYDGKLLVDRIDNQSVELEVGEEIISMDAESALDLITRLKKYTPSGFDRASQRWATSLVTYRPQSRYPYPMTGSAQFKVKDADDTVRDFSISWETSGEEYRSGSYLDIRAQKSAAPQPNILERLDRICLYDSSSEPHINFFKYAHLAPAFDMGPDFFVRMGNNPNQDEWYIGLYGVEDKTIGFVRIPQMSARNTSSMRELTNHISALENDTDGLVIDVTDNPGGLVSFCNYVSSFLHTESFPQILFEMRPSLAIIHQLEAQLNPANPDAYLVYLIDAFKTAYQNGTLTEPISLDNGSDGLMYPHATDYQGNALGYSKPIIVLINDLSVSGGDYLPATLQDSGRAKLVGYRTVGGGGHVVSYPYRVGYSETSFRLTESLMVRSKQVQPEGYPASHYIENVGVHPDFFYDYQNEEDLKNQGRGFVAFFSQIILDEIHNAEASKK